MNIFNIFRISGAGMGAQRNRMSVTAGNMANAETTRTPEGGPYQRRNVFFQAIPLGDPTSSILSTTSAKHFSGGPRHQDSGVHSIRIAGIRESSRPPRKVYDPQHPDADGEGYVSYPDINVMEEMVDMLAAARSYEANLTAFGTTRTLVRRLLEMSRSA